MYSNTNSKIEKYLSVKSELNTLVLIEDVILTIALGYVIQAIYYFSLLQVIGWHEIMCVIALVLFRMMFPGILRHNGLRVSAWDKIIASLPDHDNKQHPVDRFKDTSVSGIYWWLAIAAGVVLSIAVFQGLPTISVIAMLTITVMFNLILIYLFMFMAVTECVRGDN